MQQDGYGLDNAKERDDNSSTEKSSSTHEKEKKRRETDSDRVLFINRQQSTGAEDVWILISG